MCVLVCVCMCVLGCVCVSGCVYVCVCVRAYAMRGMIKGRTRRHPQTAPRLDHAYKPFHAPRLSRPWTGFFTSRRRILLSGMNSRRRLSLQHMTASTSFFRSRFRTSPLTTAPPPPLPPTLLELHAAVGRRGCGSDRGVVCGVLGGVRIGGQPGWKTKASMDITLLPLLPVALCLQPAVNNNMNVLRLKARTYPEPLRSERHMSESSSPPPFMGDGVRPPPPPPPPPPAAAVAVALAAAARTAAPPESEGGPSKGSVCWMDRWGRRHYYGIASVSCGGEYM